MTFNSQTRQHDIATVQASHLDLLILGGGITGAGVALQAAAAGMKVALVDMQDFGGGTSSRSTRLVHGGIRYLKTFDVEVVSDTVKERAVVQHIAPHMTTPDPMLLPIYDEPGTTFTMFSVKVAMDLYDHLAGINENPHLQKFANYTLTKDEVLAREPQLNPDHLVGGGVYLDYQNNDSRLVLENIKRAHELGGVMLSRVKAVAISHDNYGQVDGATVEDQLTGETFKLSAQLVLNAAGPWSDQVREVDADDHAAPQMRPTKGVHLVVDGSRLTVPQPTYFGSGTNDGRMIFTIPREGKTYFGTTDTDFTGDMSDPQVDQSDVDYLLGIINKKYPTAHLTLDDVEASWAGVRPLVAAEKPAGEQPDAVSGASAAASLSAPSAVSRGSVLQVGHDGLITLAGGKLTDYRVMANGALAKIRDLLQEQTGEMFAPVDSAELKVAGGDFDSDHVEEAMTTFTKAGVAAGATEAEAGEIARLFGSEAQAIFATLPTTTAAPDLTQAETAALHYSLDHEMTLSAVDYLLRRTYHILFASASLSRVKRGVINEMARYYGWDQATIDRETAAVDKAIAESQLTKLRTTTKEE